MLLDASEGMIFRDSGFCKEEVSEKFFHHGNTEFTRTAGNK